jgi:hypothetical protein
MGGGRKAGFPQYYLKGQVLVGTPLLRVYRDAANVGCSGHVTSEVRVTRVEGVAATFLGIRYPRSKQ